MHQLTDSLMPSMMTVIVSVQPSTSTTTRLVCRLIVAQSKSENERPGQPQTRPATTIEATKHWSPRLDVCHFQMRRPNTADRHVNLFVTLPHQTSCSFSLGVLSHAMIAATDTTRKCPALRTYATCPPASLVEATIKCSGHA